MDAHDPNSSSGGAEKRFACSHAWRRDRQRALGFLLLAIGMHQSINTVAFDGACPQSKNTALCNPTKIQPKVPPFQKEFLRSSSVEDCSPRASVMASGFPIDEDGVTSNCRLHSCGPTQCLVAKITKCYVPPGSDPGKDPEQPQVGPIFECVNKEWATDQQPFTWFVFVCWEFAGLLLLFHRPMECLAPAKEVTTIAGTLLLAYGSWAFQESVMIYRSCPGGVGAHGIDGRIELDLCAFVGQERRQSSTFANNLWAGQKCASYGCSHQQCLKTFQSDKGEISSAECVAQASAADVKNPLLLFWSIAMMLAAFGVLGFCGCLRRCFCRCDGDRPKPLAELHDPMLSGQGDAAGQEQPRPRFDPMTGQPQQRFDPMTGQPTAQQSQEPQPRFDPMTGQPTAHQSQA